MKLFFIGATIAVLIYIPMVFILDEYKTYRQEEQAFRNNDLKMRLKSVCQTADAIASDKSWAYKSCLKELKVFEAKEVLN